MQVYRFVPKKHTEEIVFFSNFQIVLCFFSTLKNTQKIKHKKIHQKNIICHLGGNFFSDFRL